MGQPIVFSTRLTADDWDSGVSAWRCPAVDLPSAFIKDAYAGGQKVSTDLLSIEKGPARISWKGAQRPNELNLFIGLGEKLSLVSAENFWKRLAIVVPIITAVIGVIGGWLTSKPGPAPGPVAHDLFFRIDPNDLKDSGMPPAKILLNNQEINQSQPYKMTSDATAIVDTTAAYQLFVRNRSIISDTASKIDALFPALNALNATVTGRLCSGGPNGIPSDLSGQMGQKTTDISEALRAARLQLGALTK
jgi:hypothetical protein